MSLTGSALRAAPIAVVCVMLLAAGAHAQGAGATPACAPLGYDRSAMMALRADGFALPDGAEADRFALELLPCLANPDPELRDGVAYEALAALMRGGALAPDTIRQIGADLIAVLDGPPDPEGFAQPFAALVLAEVARADRMDGVLDANGRAALLAAGASYLCGVTDYRGYDEAEGWRHGVAHAADLMMQLSLNEALTRDQLAAIRQAVASPIAPSGAHFYIYGESERLARPILFTALRGEFSEADWSAWFAALADPAPFDSWEETWTSQAGLAKQHNAKAFLNVIVVNASVSENPALKALLPGAIAALRALP